MQTIVAPPKLPVGKIKSFGAFGPRYEVGQAVRPSSGGDWVIEITLVDTGEKTEYLYEQMQSDPEAV